MQETELSESVSCLIVFEKLHFLFIGTGGHLEESFLNKVHTVAIVTLDYDILSWHGFLRNHILHDQILLLFIELLEEEGIHEVETQHYLSSLVFQAGFSKTDRLSGCVGHGIGFGTYSVSNVANHIVLSFMVLHFDEIFIMDIFESIGVCIRGVILRGSMFEGVFEILFREFYDVLGTMEDYLCDEVFENGLDLLYKVLMSVFLLLLHELVYIFRNILGEMIFLQFYAKDISQMILIEESDDQCNLNQQFAVYNYMLRNSTQKFRQRYNSSSKKSFLTTLSIESGNRQTQKLNTAISTCNIKRCSSTRKIEQIINYKQSKITTPFSSQQTQKSHNLIFKELKSCEVTFNEVSKIKILQQTAAINWKPKFKQKQQIQIEIRDPQEFIDNLRANSIFFCCKCYQYVFEIQKMRHFPVCKDIPSLELKGKQLSKYMRGKIDKILQLSKYTGTKTMQVQQLYNQITRNDLDQVFLIKYPADCLFFTREQIFQALAFTSLKLFQNPIEHKLSILGCFQ